MQSEQINKQHFTVKELWSPKTQIFVNTKRIPYVAAVSQIVYEVRWTISESRQSFTTGSHAAERGCNYQTYVKAKESKMNV